MSAPTKRPRVNAAQCGTESGYQLHLRRHQPTCQPCRDARAEYMRKWRTDPEKRQTERQVNAASACLGSAS